MTKTLNVLPALTCLLLSACATGSAGSDFNPAIGGYCPVSYFTDGKAVKGSPEFSLTHADKTYHLASREKLALFEKGPENYLPTYDGWCAYGVAYNQKVPVNPTVFSIVDDKLYLNKNRWVGRSFEKDTASYIKKADKAWPKLN